jgi:hypothetical protein
VLLSLTSPHLPTSLSNLSSSSHFSLSLSPFLLHSLVYLFHLCFDGDQGTTSKDLVQVPIGPVTRARAKKFKDVLNGLIQELWAQANSWRPIGHDPPGQQRIITLIQVLEGSGQGQ